MKVLTSSLAYPKSDKNLNPRRNTGGGVAGAIPFALYPDIEKLSTLISSQLDAKSHCLAPARSRYRITPQHVSMNAHSYMKGTGHNSHRGMPSTTSSHTKGSNHKLHLNTSSNTFSYMKGANHRPHLNLQPLTNHRATPQCTATFYKSIELTADVFHHFIKSHRSVQPIAHHTATRRDARPPPFSPERSPGAAEKPPLPADRAPPENCRSRTGPRSSCAHPSLSPNITGDHS